MDDKIRKRWETQNPVPLLKTGSKSRVLYLPRAQRHGLTTEATSLA